MTFLRVLKDTSSPQLGSPHTGSCYNSQVLCCVEHVVIYYGCRYSCTISTSEHFTSRWGVSGRIRSQDARIQTSVRGGVWERAYWFASISDPFRTSQGWQAICNVLVDMLATVGLYSFRDSDIGAAISREQGTG